ncbi:MULTISPECIES: ABC transporter permease [unclassified Mesorhizobium]|uniref:ABC transporter permease n=1 Tax=unclassified Mesorhizobium TaxID=325217 RepID=UPI000FD904F1|nr:MULTISPECIES: ABC transporter permease [unclassified Mesorhizobium]TGT71843.1 ABC transporter permease [Mesorhizobium sp. M2E.F.Ca.ET.166.01.1.1]TGV99442.1 ABC transporter permease [Mesorhizobium sp. M2E.F.Ca.ET.154.01.1.1]
MAAKPLAKTRLPTSAREYGPILSLALITPLALLLFGGFLYPVGKLFWGSIFIPDATLANYARILREPLFLVVLWRTFEIAFIVTVLALLLGYPVALAMARVSGRTALLISACVFVPLWTSVLVRSYAWIVLLQRNGLVNNALIETGLTGAPLRLLYTQGAVILAMTQVLLPFMILPIYSVVRNIPDDLVRAARNLGAGGFQAFVRVTLPLSVPGVSAGVLITFILSLGFYITPALVGGPSTLMMSTLIGQQTTELLDWPFAGTLASALLFATLLLVIVFRRALALNKGFKLG